MRAEHFHVAGDFQSEYLHLAFNVVVSFIGTTCCRCLKKQLPERSFAAILLSAKIRQMLKTCSGVGACWGSGRPLLVMMERRCAFSRSTIQRTELRGPDASCAGIRHFFVNSRQLHRVKVMTVVEGSIIVDFFLARTGNRSRFERWRCRLLHFVSF